MRINYWAKFEESCFYHIYNKGINGENLFQNEENYVFFLSKWQKYIHPYLDTSAYCLMPNHFHFLARIKPLDYGIMELIRHEGTSKSMKFLNNNISFNEFLEDQFKRLFTSYSLAFNREQNRTGSLFNKRFKRTLVENDSRLLYLLAYIHHNPIHHKFRNNYKNWRHVSYSAHLSDSSTLIMRDGVLSWFDQNDKQMAIKLFLKFHEDFQLDMKMSGLHID